MDSFLEKGHVILFFFLFLLCSRRGLLRLLLGFFLLLFLLVEYWGGAWSDVVAAVIGSDGALGLFCGFGAVDSSARTRHRGYDLTFLVGLPVECIDEHGVAAGQTADSRRDTRLREGLEVWVNFVESLSELLRDQFDPRCLGCLENLCMLH